MTAITKSFVIAKFGIFSLNNVTVYIVYSTKNSPKLFFHVAINLNTIPYQSIYH